MLKVELALSLILLLLVASVAQAGWWFWADIPQTHWDAAKKTQMPTAYTNTNPSAVPIFTPRYGPYQSWADCACEFQQILIGYPCSGNISSGCYWDGVPVVESVAPLCPGWIPPKDWTFYNCPPGQK